MYQISQRILTTYFIYQSPGGVGQIARRHIIVRGKTRDRSYTCRTEERTIVATLHLRLKLGWFAALSRSPTRVIESAEAFPNGHQALPIS